MTLARIGVGGMALNRHVVIQQLRDNTDFTIIDQPSLRGKVPPWVLIMRIWHYMDDIDLYYGISYGQWPRYLIARLRGKKTVCHWAGTDVWRVLHQPLHRWWFLLLINHCIDHHLVVSTNLREELSTLGVQTECVPLLSDLGQPDILPLPKKFTILAYLPAHRDDFYGAQIVYEIAKRNSQWDMYIVGREATSQGDTLPNVYELGPHVDMHTVYPKITALIRPTIHDGLPRMVLETLNWGRYVVFSRPFPHCLEGKSVNEIEKSLQKLSTYNQPNFTGAAYIKEMFNEEKVVAELTRVFSNTLNLSQQ